MKKILITGCAGFIGSHLTEKLLDDGHEIIGVDNFDDFYSKDIKEENLRIALSNSNFTFYEFDICSDNFDDLGQDIDCVIHLAAKAGVLPSVQNPGEFLRVNLNGTQRVLDYMRTSNVSKLVFASSSSIYGNTKEIPFTEKMDVNQPISPYASSKKSCELLIHTYHYLFDIDAVNLRFFTVYGPRQRPDLAIHKFSKKVINDEVIQVYGDGSTSRDYTYVGDTVAGISAAVDYVFENKSVYEIINLGNNSPVSLKEMIDNIFDVFGKQASLEYVEKKAGDVDITYADITKAKEILKYNPSTSFRNGLTSFKEWFLEHG